ncbi:NUDIX hydrolase [Amycolatopsis sp. NPDC059027]|uniref:NUDIX hydrolase n=1 Tax=unclassified Amycolatopsis TaxID=2618356 RepID=UPI00366C95AD
MPDSPDELIFDIPVGAGVGTRANEDGPPVTPKDAATVILLRDGGAGLEVFLQHRVRGMAFAGGMTVFPGGGVDPRDADASVRWAGPDPAWWGELFGATEDGARALVCAAVRETFEECGVLVAGIGDVPVTDVTPFAEARQDLLARRVSLAEFLSGAELTLRADLFRPWAHWVTPEAEPRRYDTRFFLAKLPEGQEADGATSEATSSGWQRPAEALEDARAGKRMLMPPTWVTLNELTTFDTAEEALAAERVITRIAPTLVREGDKVRVVLEEV